MHRHNGHETQQKDDSEASRHNVHTPGSFAYDEVHTFPASSRKLTRYPANCRANTEGQKEQKP